MSSALQTSAVSALPSHLAPALLVGMLAFFVNAAQAENLSIVPLFNSKQNELLNTWGGYWSTGVAQEGIKLGLEDGPSGAPAITIDLSQVKAQQKRFIQCFASGFGPAPEYRQTRDVLRYTSMRFRIQNVTRVPLQAVLQMKDYRDSLEHHASYTFKLSQGKDWITVDVPLELTGPGWTIAGRPDLSRVLTIDFVFLPERSIESGKICLQDVVLIEKGEPLDAATSSLAALIERLARRQWDALWAARSRQHGLIPNNSYQITDAGLNTTAAVLWMLPAAVRHGWVDQQAANSYVTLLAQTTTQLLDRAKHLPPRNVDWITLRPTLLPEESSVDAAFLALALYQYEYLATTPAQLRQEIARVRSRFDFASFATPSGWRMAYRYQTPYSSDGFIPCVYDGYTNEGNLLSLAAHLTPRNSIPIETHWNSSTHRVRACLAEKNVAPVVHRLGEYRSPFTQALWSLFVDVRQRGVDSYPDDRLAVNPWHNFVCYQQNVMTKLAEIGRPNLVQPDAGDDGTLTCYRQFSVYDNFGRNDLFMPWSAAIALLAGVDRSEAAIRFLLVHQLHDTFGLVDSARWKTGAAKPYAVTSRHDFWNTGLATMALLEWLDGDARSSRAFASLPDVRTALDRVFPTVKQHQPKASQTVIGSLAPL